ncbi:nuclear transport factor 2 family protein [Nocardia sp. NPDC059240]|uniref:nuclear transport factor 2 family protein n=1 Tax=Nocardia sp. NPDC059240 TaxID=3346786 RepID=UPI0036799A39
MSPSANTAHAETIGALYRAFETGDIPFILDQLADDVSWDADWLANTAQAAGVPQLQPRRGPHAVADFFALLSEWKFQEFTVRDVIGSTGQVAAEIELDVILPNGNRIVDQNVHLWSFDDAGKVSRLRTYGDTAKLIAAHTGGTP